MNSEEAQPPRVAVIGGGISGLAAAHRLVELAPHVRVTLFEASDRLGGVLQTERRDGFLVERAADMFITRDPWAFDLCRRIGMTDELLPTQPEARAAYVVRRGKLLAIPQGFVLMRPTQIGPVLTTPLFSLCGKLRLAAEPFIPRRKSLDDESLASFCRRRMGREAFDRLIQPLIGGIYTADPERLSMKATMSQFVEMEQQHGSLLRAALRSKRVPRGTERSGDKSSGSGDASKTPASNSAAGAGEDERRASGARYGLFVAPRDGMSSLVDRLATRLPVGSVRLNSPVRKIRILSLDAGDERSQGARSTWIVTTDARSDEPFDGLILATPAPAAGRLMADVEPALAKRLNAIPYAGVIVAVVAVRRDQVNVPPVASGYVTPIIEGRDVLALSFTSRKFSGRAPDGQLLVRIFIGGAIRPELNDLSDEEIERVAVRELREILELRGEPLWKQIVRWNGAMPQYHVGHLDRIAEIEQVAARWPNLALAGNAYRGVGIPFCVRSGENAAARVLERMNAAN